MNKTYEEFLCEGNFPDGWVQFLNFLQISDQASAEMIWTILDLNKQVKGKSFPKNVMILHA